MLGLRPFKKKPQQNLFGLQNTIRFRITRVFFLVFRFLKFIVVASSILNMRAAQRDRKRKFQICYLLVNWIFIDISDLWKRSIGHYKKQAWRNREAGDLGTWLSLRKWVRALKTSNQ